MSLSLRTSKGHKRSRSGRGSGHPLVAEINVTPFVDVMLVLLIVFMVSAPLMTSGVPLKLPSATSTPLSREQQEPLTLSIDPKGKVFLQKVEFSLQELPQKLQAILTERKSDRIFLRADATVDYGQVMKVMGYLSAAGFHNIGLVTDSRDAGSATGAAEQK